MIYSEFVIFLNFTRNTKLVTAPLTGEPTLGARDRPQRRQGCKPVCGQLAMCSPHERKGGKPTVAVWALHNTVRWLWYRTWCFLSIYPKSAETPLVRVMFVYLIYSLGVYKVVDFCLFVLICHWTIHENVMVTCTKWAMAKDQKRSVNNLTMAALH